MRAADYSDDYDNLLKKPWRTQPLVITDQGIAGFALRGDATGGKVSHLGLVDLLTLELVGSTPRDQADGVPLDSPLVLRFTRSLGAMSDEQLRQFLVLQRDAQGDQPAVSLPFALQRSADQRTLTLVPEQALLANASHQLILKGDLASRRSRGLMEHAIHFRSGLAGGAQVAILDSRPSMLDVGGGEIEVRLSGVTGQPQFTVSGQTATGTLAESLPDGSARYRVQAPASLPGPASLQVVAGNGSKATRVGAVQFVEPLLLRSLSPSQGSLNGGTRVLIKGQGFRSELGAMTVSFGDILAEQFKVLDGETLEVITPPGPIGTVDVRVRLANGQQGTLAQSFTFQQPPQSQIRDKGRVYDLALDPSGSYLFSAQGSNGVLVYDLNAGNYTADPQKPLNPDDLLRLIDRNRDGRDDRVISAISLPSGYIAVGVEPYFERGSDRVYITAVHLAGGKPDAAQLFTVAFDSLDPSRTTLIGSLELPSSAVRGLRVRNARVLLAMGEEGLGVVDAFLPNKTYLVESLASDPRMPMLDVATRDAAAGESGLLVTVGGAFDFPNNRLLSKEENGSGGFQVYGQSSGQGLQRLGHLDLPGTRVVLQGRYAYVAAGASGVAVVDLQDPNRPQVVARVNDIGYVYDLDYNGNTLYVARGDKGVLSIDVTDPLRPQPSRSMQAPRAAPWKAWWPANTPPTPVVSTPRAACCRWCRTWCSSCTPSTRATASSIARSTAACRSSPASTRPSTCTRRTPPCSACSGPRARPCRPPCRSSTTTPA